MEWIYLTSRKVPLNVTASPSNGDQASFFGAVGRCITAWTFVENSLLHVYSVALGPIPSDSIAASFHEVQTFNTRLMMTNSAVVFAQPGAQLLARWDGLHRVLLQGAKVRNRVAHGTVYFDPDRAGSEQLFLAHGLSNPKKPNLQILNEPGLIESVLSNEAAKARKLSSEIFDFGEALAKHLHPGRIEIAKYIVELDAKGISP